MTGTGTLADPFIIWDVDDLQAMKDNLTAYYELGCDIDASATSGWNGGLGFLPAGNDASRFIGHLDGKEYLITNLYINRTSDYNGLFGVLGGAAQVKNLNFVNVSIKGSGYSGYVGALAGKVEPSAGGNITIENCHVISGQTGSYGFLGGLVGFGYITNASLVIKECSSGASIIPKEDYNGGLVGLLYLSNGGSVLFNSSYSTGSVAGGYYAGGLIGAIFSYGGTTEITGCYTTGAITSGAGWNNSHGGLIGCYEANEAGCVLLVNKSYATGSINGENYVGGLIGNTIIFTEGATITIQECFATGNVSGENYGGGLIGSKDGTVENCYARGNVVLTEWCAGGLIGINGEGLVDKCYSTGLVSGATYVGGLIGRDSGSVTGSFWDTQTSGQATSSGGTGKTTAEMKNKSTFVTAGWDFTTPIWLLVSTCNDSYPCLFGVTPSCLLRKIHRHPVLAKHPTLATHKMGGPIWR